VGGRNALSLPYCDSFDDDEVVAVGVDFFEAGDVDMRFLVQSSAKSHNISQLEQKSLNLNRLGGS
jgi:hypothetical protein